MNKEDLIKEIDNIKKIYYPIASKEIMKIEMEISGLNFKLNCLENAINNLEKLIKEKI